MEITTHAPGTFCWFELGTTDPKAAKAFYTQLFGWDVTDIPIGEMGTYTMLQKGDDEVAALYRLNDEQQTQGVPPHWLAYVAVTDADDVAARTRAHGGTVVAAPMDVFEHGRMAVLQDPTGATFAIWQPRKHPGAGVLGVPGSVCWNELATTDAEAAGDFYTSVFGWGTQTQEMEYGPYTSFMRDEQHPSGGMMQMTEEWGDVPSHWMIYFAVEDCDAAAEQVEALGGRVCVPPTDIPGVGRFAVIDDPQGATFSMMHLAERS